MHKLWNKSWRNLQTWEDLADVKGLLCNHILNVRERSWHICKWLPAVKKCHGMAGRMVRMLQYFSCLYACLSSLPPFIHCWEGRGSLTKRNGVWWPMLGLTTSYTKPLQQTDSWKQVGAESNLTFQKLKDFLHAAEAELPVNALLLLTHSEGGYSSQDRRHRSSGIHPYSVSQRSLLSTHTEGLCSSVTHLPWWESAFS